MDPPVLTGNHRLGGVRAWRPPVRRRGLAPTRPAPPARRAGLPVEVGVIIGLHKDLYQPDPATVRLWTNARVSSHAAVLASAKSVALRSKKLCGAPGYVTTR